jgi:hypothetical protein
VDPADAPTASGQGLVTFISVKKYSQSRKMDALTARYSQQKQKPRRAFAGSGFNETMHAQRASLCTVVRA